MDYNSTKKRTPQNDTVFDNFSHKKPKPEPEPEKANTHLDYLLTDEIFTDFTFDEDELSKLLLDTPTCPISTSTCPPPCPVKFVSYPYVSPAVDFSSSYVTINGNDETCGSSFSVTDPSLMLGFDTANVSISDPFALWSGACSGACHGFSDVASGDDWDWSKFLFGDDLTN